MSAVVQGYGNALYRMGRRYESGDGAASNPREALRCFSKSARLGNFWAMARLASHVFAAKTDSEDVVVNQAISEESKPQSPPSDPAELPSPTPPAH
jgi:TPR repeat protein